MNFEKFNEILNKHIFQDNEVDLLKKIANHPERFVGLFRPTKPNSKILQFLLQSHEIRFGNALEEVLKNILKSEGYYILENSIDDKGKDKLFLDILCTKDKKYYFIELKVRDDHDSTKKRGQISNFKKKLENLFEKYNTSLVAIMYFIDPDLSKNEKYYRNELDTLAPNFNNSVFLFYGPKLFEHFNISSYWEKLLDWLKKWKDTLPDIPQVNFDLNSPDTFEKIKKIKLSVWKKIIEKDIFWTSGIINVLFNKEESLQRLLEFFQSKSEKSYQKLSKQLEERIQNNLKK